MGKRYIEKYTPQLINHDCFSYCFGIHSMLPKVMILLQLLLRFNLLRLAIVSCLSRFHRSHTEHSALLYPSDILLLHACTIFPILCTTPRFTSMHIWGNEICFVPASSDPAQYVHSIFIGPIKFCGRLSTTVAPVSEPMLLYKMFSWLIYTFLSLFTNFVYLLELDHFLSF